MDRIDVASASSFLPTPGPVGPNPNGYFKQKSSTEPGTTISSDWANAVQEELCNVVIGAGLELDRNNNSQLLAAIEEMILVGPSGSGLTKLQDDPEPILGENLNLNGFKITSQTGKNVVFSTPTYISAGVDGQLNVLSRLNYDLDANNYIELGSNQISFKTSNVVRIDINSSGLRVGGGGSRVSTVLDEDDMASNSPTALTTQNAFKAYADSFSMGAGQIISSPIIVRKDWSGMQGFGLNATGFIMGESILRMPIGKKVRKVFLWLQRTGFSGTSFNFTVRVLSSGANALDVTFAYSAIGVDGGIEIMSQDAPVHQNVGDDLQIIIGVTSTSLVDRFDGSVSMLLED